MDLLREGTRFRGDVLSHAINYIVDEGFQENFDAFAVMYNEMNAAGKLNYHELLNWD